MTLSWLSPVWLWGLAAVAVPMVIHLISQSAGRPVAFAAVRFVPRAASRRLLGLTLSQPLLLLVRSLLLAALAVFLAGPQLHADARPPGATAVLVSALALASQPEAARARAASLALEHGARPRVLERGFPGLENVPAARRPAEAVAAELDDVLAGYERVLVVAAANGADRLWSAAPLEARLQWLELAPSSDSVFTVQVVASAARTADARYVAAAVSAVAQSPTTGSWRVLEGNAAGPADVVFRLGADAPASPPAQRLTVVDSAAPLQRDVITLEGVRFAIGVAASAPNAGVVLLTSAGGQPVVTLAGSTLHWQSRFISDASELVTSEQFPQLIRRWLQLAAAGPPAWDAQPPSRPLWPALIVLLLWLAERAISLLDRRGPYD